MIANILHAIAGMEREDEGTYRPRPSMAGPERCVRQMTYHRMGTEPDKQMGDRFLHVLNDSSWHEELTGDWLGKSAFVLHSRQMGVTLPGVFPWLPGEPFSCPICQQTVCPQDLHGHIDGIVTDLLRMDRLWEHKALSHWSFEAYWDMATFPEDYFTQCAIYLRGLQMVNPDLREAVLLVKNKNTSGFIEYLLRYDTPTDALTACELTRHTGETLVIREERPRIVAEAVEKFLSVELAARDQTVPPRPDDLDPDHWKCRYCRWSETCWAGYAAEVAAQQVGVALPPDLLPHVQAYVELGRTTGQQDKEREEMRDHFVAAMKEIDAREACVGPYVLKRTVQDKRKIDWTAVPPALVAQLELYKYAAPVEILRVTTPKKPSVAPPKEPS